MSDDEVNFLKLLSPEDQQKLLFNSGYKHYLAMEYRHGGRKHYTICVGFDAVGSVIEPPREFKKSDGTLENVKQRRRERPFVKEHMVEILDYMNGEEKFVLGTITVDAVKPENIEFLPFRGVKINIVKMGVLLVKEGTPLELSDGQHRRLAIMRAAQQNPEKFASQAILIDIIVENDVWQAQQDFVDMNNVMPMQKGLTTAFNRRNIWSRITIEVVEKVPGFGDANIDPLGKSISKSSTKLFTIVNVRNAIAEFLTGDSQISTKKADETIQTNFPRDSPEYLQAVADCVEFFTTMSEKIPSWKEAIEMRNPRSVDAVSKLRSDNLNLTGVGLLVMARVGYRINQGDPSLKMARYKALAGLDWSRKNEFWKGLVGTDYQIVSSRDTIAAAADAASAALGIMP